MTGAAKSAGHELEVARVAFYLLGERLPLVLFHPEPERSKVHGRETIRMLSGRQHLDSFEMAVASIPPVYQIDSAAYGAAMDIYAIRLRNLVTLQGEMTRQQLAEKLGMDYGQVGHFFMNPETKGHRNIGARTARRIETMFGKPTGWMDQNHTGPIPYGGNADHRAVKIAQIVSEITQPPLTPDTYSIPKLDIGGAMGVVGEVVPEYETVVGQIDVNQQWVRSHLPQITSPHNLRMITGYGDSMEGTYNDGDLLFVDTGVQEVKLDAVYVFALNGDLYVKRLQRRPDGSITVISDNKKYEPYRVDDREQVRVIGRVVYAWNGKRL